MKPTALLLLCTALAGCALAPAEPVAKPAASPDSACTDPPRDAEHPATNRPLLIASHGFEMNGVFFLAAGAGPKPTLLLLHGLPGHERNLDLAQAVRRAGWNVLTFTYRGAWGSTGAFSIANAVEDADAVLQFVRTPEAVRSYDIDPNRIVVAGHSMGGFAAALTVARDKNVAGLVLIDAWNAGATAQQIAAAGEAGRAALIASVQLGHSLQGTTAEGLAQELMRSSGWNLLDRAADLGATAVLTIYASEGFAPANRALAQAINNRPGSRLQAIEMQTEHDFADHRLALGTAIVAWLARLDGKK